MIQIRIKKKNKKRLKPQFATKVEIVNELEKMINNEYIKIVKLINFLIRLLVGGNIINCLDAKDIVSIAVQKLLDDQIDDEKKRNWDKANCPSFIAFFINVCKSLVWNEYKKYCRKHGIKLKNNKREIKNFQEKFNALLENDYLNSEEIDRYEFMDEDNDITTHNFKRYRFYDINESKFLNRVSYNDWQNEEYLSNEELERITIELENKIKSYFLEDPFALVVLDELLNGEKRDRFISKKHKIPINEVRNAKKRIKRKLKMIGQKNGG